MITKLKNLLKLNQVIRENNSLLKELLRAQVFESTIRESDWLKNKSFSPGGWAIDYATLYTLYRVLNGMRPKNILEFGLGQSSRMIYQYTSFYEQSFAQTIEHDPSWIDFFKNNIRKDYEINITMAELEKVEYKKQQTLRYKSLLPVLQKPKYDLILIDAPFVSPHYSRSQILEIVPSHIDAKNFCIIMDDYNRRGEQETIADLCDLLTHHKISFKKKIYSGSKEHALICSENLPFLVSL